MDNLIVTSREKIRQQLADLSKQYLEIQDVDFSKSHYLSYLLDVLSTLSTNLLFFSSTSLHESNLLTARLDDSIRNLAQFIGYNPDPATPANVDALFTIDLSDAINMNDFRIIMHEDFQLQSDNNIFRLYKQRVIIERINGSFKITLETPYGNVLIPFDWDNVTGQLSFMVNFTQIDYREFEYVIDTNLKPYQFYTITQNINGNLSDVEVKVDNILWSSTETVYLLTSNDEKFMIKYYPNKFVLIFGNGIFGKQPEPGKIVNVKAYITNGSKGNIISGTLQKKDRLYIENPGGPPLLVNYEVTNVSSGINGKDLESNEDIKRRAINGLSSLKRLVSRLDYEALKDITNIPFDTSISYLKRSDIKTNEVNTYGVITFKNEIVPTTCFTLPVARPNEPPVIKILSVNVNQNNGDVTIQFRLEDPDFDNVSVKCYYSVNSGIDWNYTNHITGNLLSLSTPGDYTIVWHSDQDFHGHYQHVIFKMIPHDTLQTGLPVYTDTMEIINNHIPEIDIVQRVGDFGDIYYTINLYDEDGDFCDLELQYSMDSGNTWNYSNHLSGYQHLSNGNHILIWHSEEDGVRYGDVIVRINPKDPYQRGDYVEDTFLIKNNNKPYVNNVRVYQYTGVQ